MKGKKLLLMAAVVLTFTGVSCFNQAQAQIVEFPDKGISLWIPDRFHNWSNFSTSKIFECRKANSSENDSEIRIDIIRDFDSVGQLVDRQERMLFISSELIGKQTFVGADGSDQAYILYNEKTFGKWDLKGVIYVDLGNDEKLRIKSSTPVTESNQEDFNDMLDSICTGASSSSSSNSSNSSSRSSSSNSSHNSSNSHTYHESKHRGFHISIGW